MTNLKIIQPRRRAIQRRQADRELGLYDTRTNETCACYHLPCLGCPCSHHTKPDALARVLRPTFQQMRKGK